MRRRFGALLAALLLTLTALPTAAGGLELVPVGEIIGLELETDGVYVAGFPPDRAETPAREAGIRCGDRIISVNGAEITDAAQLQARISEACGGQLVLNVEREGRALSFRMEPMLWDGAWRIGVLVRDRIAGLGTVTFYDPETGLFGALGHGVCGTGGTEPMQLRAGAVRRAEAASIRRGCAGTPGALLGSPETGDYLGQITENTPQGVFGRVRPGCWQAEPVPLAEPGEVTVGPAEILTCVCGGAPRRCSVEIEALRFDGERSRNLRLRVTDSDLLKAAGGIVQGMSGSPILQNGKLIGAVTHVLTQDPTRGYGIFIQYMLEAAQEQEAA